MTNRSHSFLSWIVLIWLVVAVAGCGEQTNQMLSQIKKKSGELAESASEKMKDMSEQASETLQESTQQVKEQAGLAGSAQFILNNAPLQTEACYVRFVAGASGRPSVLQIASCLDERGETTPTFLVHAQSSAASLSELTGQEVEAQMYLMTDEDAGMWQTTPPALVKVTIGEVTPEKMVAELASSKVVNLAAEPSEISGSFDAVVINP